jgi:hypothetical protein
MLGRGVVEVAGGGMVSRGLWPDCRDGSGDLDEHTDARPEVKCDI